MGNKLQSSDISAVQALLVSCGLKKIPQSICLLIFLFLTATANADTSEISREQKIKAAYLYHLTKFIDWPNDHPHQVSESVNVCAMGKSPFALFLKKLETKSVKGRAITVTLLELAEQANPNCHIVFYQSDTKNSPKQLQEFADYGTLTVGEQHSFTDTDGMVAMVMVKNHIRLRINYTLAKQANILMSANLLEVATIVK